MVQVVVKAEISTETNDVTQKSSDVTENDAPTHSVHRQVIQIVNSDEKEVDVVTSADKVDDEEEAFELDSLEVVAAINSSELKSAAHRKISDTLSNNENAFLDHSRITRR